MRIQMASSPKTKTSACNTCEICNTFRFEMKLISYQSMLLTWKRYCVNQSKCTQEGEARKREIKEMTSYFQKSLKPRTYARVAVSTSWFVNSFVPRTYKEFNCWKWLSEVKKFKISKKTLYTPPITPHHTNTFSMLRHRQRVLQMLEDEFKKTKRTRRDETNNQSF